MCMSSLVSRFVIATVAVVTIAGCATPKVVDPPRDGASFMGIQLTTTGPLGPLSIEIPEEVIFVKLTSDGLLGEELMRSNHASGDRIYLLNVDPGTYAAVASIKSVPSPFPYGAPGTRTTFFPSQMISATRVEIGAGEFAFMGKFDVALPVPLSGSIGPDEAQLHYQRIIVPGASTKSFMDLMVQSMSGEMISWGGLRSGTKDSAVKDEFFRGTAQSLSGPTWDAIISRAAAAQK